MVNFSGEIVIDRAIPRILKTPLLAMYHDDKTGNLTLEVELPDVVLGHHAHPEIVAEGDVGAEAAARVGCVTCHRGVAIPKQLADILDQTTTEKGKLAMIFLKRGKVSSRQFR